MQYPAQYQPFLREAAKKGSPLVVRPLGGGGGCKGRTTTAEAGSRGGSLYNTVEGGLNKIVLKQYDWCIHIYNFEKSVQF